jgi:hypothetical protein
MHMTTGIYRLRGAVVHLWIAYKQIHRLSCSLVKNVMTVLVWWWHILNCILFIPTHSRKYALSQKRRGPSHHQMKFSALLLLSSTTDFHRILFYSEALVIQNYQCALSCWVLLPLYQFVCALNFPFWSFVFLDPTSTEKFTVPWSNT